jgi:TatD DNase family protein
VHPRSARRSPCVGAARHGRRGVRRDGRPIIRRLALFDSHCHLTDEKFADDVDGALGRARDAGLNGLVTIASDLADAPVAAALAARAAGVWCTAGVHPHAADTIADVGPQGLEEALARPRVVAIGEAGLDYHYDNAPREAQRRVFGWQMEIAARTGLPLVVHSRDADDDVGAMVRGSGATGVLHCFTGGSALLDAALEAGWMISFSGLISFRKYDGADLLRAVPRDRLLVETDSPYLAPVPNRGRRNEPSFLPHTCAAAAKLRGESVAELAAVTEANARRFYRIGPEVLAPPA